MACLGPPLTCIGDPSKNGGFGELVRLVRPPVTGISASCRLRFRFVRVVRVRVGEVKLRGRMTLSLWLGLPDVSIRALFRFPRCRPLRFLMLFARFLKGFQYISCLRAGFVAIHMVSRPCRFF